MDGYSVSEAASVLGVPIERVWELLARGVLAGAPEGETGMRVFLHPRPAPAPAPISPPPAENGGPRDPDRELSPFRELLTEFRNLTERYGQALLALGESRGEVAALRSRVDLLEARMDLGLPAPGRVRTQGTWGGGSFETEQTVVPAAHAPDEAERAREAEEHRARARGPRRATESFAEALARAEDPSLPELPKPEVESAHEAPEAPVLPRELPAAEMVPVAEEAGAPMPAEGVAGEAPVDQQEAEPTAPPETQPEPQPEPEPAAVAEPESPAEAVAAGAQTVAEAATWDSERYTADIEEPDWYEAEADEAPAAEPEPATDEASEAPEETLFWLEGDEAEADSLPGSSELESALEALSAEAHEPADTPTTPEVPAAPEEPGEDQVATARADPEAPQETARPSPSSALPPSALRYRPVTPAGPTGRAYRRLRRIFPD
jgi:hypothetical protein